MPTFQDEVDQLRYQQAAVWAQRQDPRFNALVDKVLKSLTGKPLSALPQDVQKYVMWTAMALQNSLGLENAGDQFSDIFSGVMRAGPMPVMAGGPGSSRATFTGTAYGAGNLQTSVAMGIYQRLKEGLQNSHGGMNYAVTHGLGAGTITQMASDMIARRGFRSGDVESVNMGNTAEEFRRGLARFATISGDTDSRDYKMMLRGAEAREAMDALRDRFANTTFASDIEAQKFLSEGIANLTDRHGKKFTETEKEIALQQERGTLNATAVSKELSDTLLKGIKTMGGNVKMLADIFETKDFKVLQANAVALNMGSLTDARNVNSIRARLERASVTAAMTNRTTADVLAEQASIQVGLSSYYGGAAYVPVHATEHVQRQGILARQANENGFNRYTADERQGQAGRTAANASQIFRGVPALEHAIRVNGGSMSPEQLTEAYALLERFKASTDRAEQKELSRQAMKMAALISPDAYTEAYMREAQAKSTIDLSAHSTRTAAPKWIDSIQRKYSRRANGNPQATYSKAEAAAGGYGGLNALLNSLRMTAGGDLSTLTAMQSQADKLRELGVDEGAASLEQLRQDLVGNGMSSKDAQAYINVISKLAGMSKQGAGSVGAIYTSSVNESPTLGQLESSISKNDRAVVQLREYQKRMAGYNAAIKASGSGLSAFLGGVLGDGGISMEEAAVALVARRVLDAGEGVTLQDAVGDTGIVLGAMEGGKFVNREAFLKNAAIQQALGIENAGDEAQWRSRMDSAEGSAAVIATLQRNGFHATMHGQNVVALNAKEVEAHQKKLDEYEIGKQTAGIAQEFFGGDTRVLANDADGTVTVVRDGNSYTMEQALVDEMRRDPEKVQTVRAAAASGNKSAVTALAMARDTYNATLLGKISGRKDFAVLAQNAGFKDTNDLKAAFDKAQSAQAHDALTQRIFGTKNLFELGSHEIAAERKLVDADDKLLGGAFKGRSRSEVLKALGGESGIQELMDLNYLVDGSSQDKVQTDILQQILNEVRTIGNK